MTGPTVRDLIVTIKTCVLPLRVVTVTPGDTVERLAALGSKRGIEQFIRSFIFTYCMYSARVRYEFRMG
jgi:predicted Zn-dependent protease